ncbi:hypothetical protein FG379_002780 [Cryptosporidium bovis]|uniref:uncharacterized protein n=1 Tax=Cryptosporidium bovis TaxID=310047 RepID=UPI00351A3ED3|nr:hypothetical protein FG379_002780 [Cryptosporidium bovis]
MRGEKRNREISDSYQEDEGEKVGSELGKFLELFGEEIKLSMSKKSSIIESTEAINKILDNINNVDIDNNVLFYFVNDKAIRIFEEYLLYLESKIDSETSDIIFKSLKLFLNVIFDISNLEYGGEYENIKPMVLGMFLDSNIIKNLMDVINKVELQFENECNLISKKSTYYEEILFDYFNLLESILELDPKRSSSELLKCKKLFSWLLNSLEDDIGKTGGDNNARANKAIGSISQSKIEILSIMFQNMNYSDIIELETFSVNIMDLLLIKLANMGLINGEVIGYENREFVHNIIDIICSLLLFEKERLNFVELEGIELMLKFIKEKIFLRSLSVKVLSFALLSNSSINNKFVKL